jgi:hypothetical protein
MSFGFVEFLGLKKWIRSVFSIEKERLREEARCMRFSAIRAIFVVLINMSLPKRETEISSTYDVV